MFYTFRGDGAQLVADSAKAGDEAGAKGGAAFEASFGKVAKKLAGGIAGAIGGFAVGSVLNGANELDAAAHKLAADTGLTGEAAKEAEHALAGMYRNNLQGFDQIGAAMAKVHNDLGLAGKEADATTARFLKFSTATGQDAAEAVGAFDDILDAWNLTAAEAGGLMDKLIVSHQKFGGSITESESALKQMAPAMQAANMTIDDGIALLNLFNVAGIDAAKAPAALAKAVKQLKPGQDINDLIRQLAAIESPTLRAQRAMELFGAKSGIGFAQAIKPGMSSLADLTAALGDTTDATIDAAGAIEGSFGNRVKLALKGVQGQLSEFGASFGDVALLASAFGPKITSALASGLGGLAGLLIPQVVGAVAATEAPAVATAAGVGTATGTAMGGAMLRGLVTAFPPALLALAIGGAVVLVANKLSEARSKELAGIEADTKAATERMTVEQIRQQKETLERSIEAMDAAAAAGKLSGQGVVDRLNAQTQLDVVTAQLDAAEKALKTSGQKAGEAVGEGLAAGVAEVPDDVKLAAARFGKDVAAAVAAAATDDEDLGQMRQSGKDLMFAYGAGIREARQKPLDAFDTLVEMLKHQLTPAAEAARLAGQLTSQELAAGLKSKDPEVRAQAIGVQQLIVDRLKELVRQGGPLGKDAMQKLIDGTKSKDPDLRAAAAAAITAINDELTSEKSKAATQGSGETLAQNAAAGLQSETSKGVIISAAGALATIFGLTFDKATAGNIQRFMDREHQTGAFTPTTDGSTTPNGRGFATGGRPQPGVASWVGERGPELWVPDGPGTILPADASRRVTMAAVAAAGQTTTINVQLPTTARPSPFEVATQMRRMARLGLLGAPKAPAGAAG